MDTGFRIYYSDGSTYDGDRPGDPGMNIRGIQAIVQKNSVTGWHTESRGDYYIAKEDGLWHHADFDGLFTELKKLGLIRPRIGVLHDVWAEGQGWVTVDQIGFHQWIEDLGFVLCGETIGNDRFSEIFQDALADADFGRRNGYLAGERKPVND